MDIVGGGARSPGIQGEEGEVNSSCYKTETLSGHERKKPPFEQKEARGVTKKKGEF